MTPVVPRFEPTVTLPAASPSPADGFGAVLRYHRQVRQLSQLDLAVNAGTSPRHLSFLESGRSNPSREMVLRLADALMLTLRDRNQLLSSAGFAPLFTETPLGGDLVSPHRQALESILAKQEPYPALVADPNWNLRMRNDAMMRMARAFVPAENFAAAGVAAANAVKYLFDPLLFRPYILDWELVAAQMLERLRNEGARDLIAELMRYPGVPAGLLERHVSSPSLNDPVMTVRLAKGDLVVNYFSILSTFGLPQDITLQELRIKLFFPADTATQQTFARLAS